MQSKDTKNHTIDSDTQQDQPSFPFESTAVLFPATPPSKLEPFVSCGRYDSNSNDILSQINHAFQTAPNIAGTLHGQRRIHQGGRGQRTALFPSRKAGGAIPLESKLELAYAVELERDPTVQNYRTQAIKISLSKANYAIPDFLILRSSGAIEIHEVKPSIQDLALEQLDKLNALKLITNELGINFKIIDSTTLCSGKTLDKILHQYTLGHAIKWTEAQVAIATKLLKGQSLSVNDAYTKLIEYDLPPHILEYLYFHKKI